MSKTKYQRGNFITLPNKHLLAGLDPHAQVIYIWLVNFSGDDGGCFPSIKRIANLCAISEKTVNRKIGILIKAGLIDKITRKKPGSQENDTNLYTINIKEASQEEIECVNRFGGLNKEPQSEGGVSETPRGDPETPQVGSERPRNYNHINSIHLSRSEAERERESLSNKQEVREISVNEQGEPIEEKVPAEPKPKGRGTPLSLSKHFTDYRENLYKKETGENLFSNEMQRGQYIKKNLGAAKKLIDAGYSRDRILECIKYCAEEYDDWNLHTVVKKIGDMKLIKNKQDA